MMPGEFDKLAASDSAYFVRDADEGWHLVERATGKIVFEDQMEPEDAMLVRDLYPLVELLNRTARERDEVQAALLSQKTLQHIALAIVASDSGDPLSSVKVYDEDGKTLGYLPKVASEALRVSR